MQQRREVRDDKVFKSGGLGNFGDFGFHRNMMMPSLFGGRDPFDDPFFTDPFDNSIWGVPSATGSRLMQKNTNRDKGVIIQELDSDEEQETDQKISRSSMEPTVEHPDDDDDDVDGKNVGATLKNDHHQSEASKGHNFSFRTSRVTYGGIDGAYYSSSKTRRRGADGAVVDESKEANSTTGQATHRITRGIQDKGHSVLRKLDSDGKVDITQTLHNLHEDELEGFEKAWKGNNMGQLSDYDVHRKKDSSVGWQNQKSIWSLPSFDQTRRARASNSETGTNSGGRTKKVVRISIE